MRKTTILLAMLALPTMALAHADDFDAQLAQRCPATKAWMDAHPARANGDEAMAHRDAQRHFSDPALRKQLAERFAKDQAVRDKAIAAKHDKPSVMAMVAVDKDNLAWLKPLVLKHGFPTIAQVGEQGVSHAWTLVQHADSDLAFQEKVLHELASRLQSGGIGKSEYALLTDRVRVDQGKPQVYGSQFALKHGKLVLSPLEDPQHVDRRRATMGMMPLADYRCVLTVAYKLPDPQNRKPDASAN